MFFILVMCLSSLAAFLMLLDFFVKNYTTYKIAKTMQGPPMLPIIGNIQFLFCSQDKMYEIRMDFCNKFKNGFAYWTFRVFIYHIYSAESFEKIVTNSKHIEKSYPYRFLQLLLGTGLLTSRGEKWFARRKLLTPAFHFNILNGFQSTFNDQTEILLREIREKELNNPEGTHLQRLISRFTLNTICESAMGVKLTKIDELDDYRSKINQIGKLQVERLNIPWMYLDWAYFTFGNGKYEKKIIDQAHAFTGNVITTKRKTFILNREHESNSSSFDLDYNNKRRFAMLDILLDAEQNQNLIDDAGIQEEVDTFVFEGFDTTMTAITFILFSIANHEDVQKRLYEEISSLDVIDDVNLPAGTTIHILINKIHRDPKYFPDPDKFDPNRFLNNEIKHPFAYVPFSAGQRNCIGQKFAMMELRTAIGEIINNFKLESITKVEDVVMIADLIMRSRDPIRVRFLPRYTQ